MHKRNVRLTKGLSDTWGHDADGRAWLSSLGATIDRVEARWSIHVGGTLPGSNVSYVAPAVGNDGSQYVLKVNYPEDESRDEGPALRHWDGSGAVRILDEDPESGALLLERVVPGTSLETEREATAVDVIASILRLFTRPPPSPHTFRELDVVARHWQAMLAEFLVQRRGIEEKLVEVGIGEIDTLVGTSPSSVVLHQDLHAGNVLLAEGGRWVAIDPKPMVGDPSFDAASLLRDRRPELARDPDAKKRIRYRLDELSDQTGMDRGRMRGWGIVHALAWGIGANSVDRELVDAARLIAGA